MLKDFRERKGLSIEELAQASGIAAKRITQFETAEHSPLFDELFMLAEGLRIRASTIARRIHNLTSKIVERPAAAREARA